MPLNPTIEAQCFIAGCLLHRSGYDLASPIAIMLACDLSKPLSERRFLGGWGDGAGVWDVDITDADGLEQMMERAAPVLAALHQGAVLGPARIANHMRARIDRGDLDICGVLLLYQNCAPLMRDQRGVSARAKRAMHDLLDEIINEADAHAERFVGLAADGLHVTKPWSQYRLRGNAIAPVVDQRLYFLKMMESLVPALNATAERMRENGVPFDATQKQEGDALPSQSAAVGAVAVQPELHEAMPKAREEASEPRPVRPTQSPNSSKPIGCIPFVLIALAGVAAYLFFR